LAVNPISAREESVSPERDDYRDEDEQDEYMPRSIFAAGWFRAALVLTVLAIVVVISLPYLLNWFEPAPPPRVARQADAPAAVAPTPLAPAAVPVPAEPRPAAPGPKAAVVSPAAPKAVEKSAPRPAETAVAPAPARTAEPDRSASKAAERRVPEKTTVKAAEAPPAKVAERSDKGPAKTMHAPATKAPETPARVAKSDGPAKLQAAVKAETPAPVKAQTVAVAKTDAAIKTEPAALSKTAAVAAAKSTSSGNYWIQLGAFKDRQNADVLAKAVRGDGFAVHVTPISKGAAETNGAAAQQHELFVTDARVEKVNAALKGRGTGQPAAGGIAVRPAFSLQEAMSVSKRLTDEGLKVVIRPASGPGAPTAASPATLYAVRAGGYADRSSAVAARDELAGKGHRGFLAEGPAR
jgi:cell division septation protein DedD